MSTADEVCDTLIVIMVNIFVIFDRWFTSYPFAHGLASESFKKMILFQFKIEYKFRPKNYTT